MSTQITTAFVNQFSSNVQMLSQQMGSLLRTAVDSESVNGEKAFLTKWGQHLLSYVLRAMRIRRWWKHHTADVW